MSRGRSIVALALGVAAGLLGGCAIPYTGPTIPTGADRIPATLLKPDGPGPFPAVVVLHDCSGLGVHSSGAPDRWARELMSHGYVALVPDSFTTRGHAGGVCTDASRSRNDVSPARRVHDAYAALGYLRTLSYVDGHRVGLMGGSHGGTTVLATLTAPEGPEGFAAAVALYPTCRPGPRGWRADLNGVYRPVAPLLILIGENDDWTPAEACRELAEAARAAGEPVTLKVYPGAHHAFDSPRPVRYVAARINANSPTGRGATTGGDPEAWADSLREVLAFFARQLR